MFQSNCRYNRWKVDLFRASLSITSIDPRAWGWFFIKRLNLCSPIEWRQPWLDLLRVQEAISYQIPLRFALSIRFALQAKLSSLSSFGNIHLWLRFVRVFLRFMTRICCIEVITKSSWVWKHLRSNEKTPEIKQKDNWEWKHLRSIYGLICIYCIQLKYHESPKN